MTLTQDEFLLDTNRTRSRGGSLSGMNLLIECARPNPIPARLSEAAGGVTDWDFALEQAARHGVAPLLYWHLRQCAGILPRSVFDRLRAHFNENGRRNLIFAAELLRLLARFEQAGIQVVPFKGPATAWFLYETPALREMSDLDVLARPSQAARAIDLLVATGYESPYSRDLRFFRSNYELALRSPSGVTVDLHWGLAPSFMCSGLDTDGLWTRLKPAQVAGRNILTFSEEDLLVFLCIHGAKHGWPTLRWLADLARLMERSNIDWDALLARVAARRISRIVFSSLLLAVAVLGAAVPAAIVTRMRSHVAASDIAEICQARLLSDDSKPPALGEILCWLYGLLERPADKFKFCWNWVAPTPADHEAFPLPPSLFPLYFALRPLRLMSHYVRRPRVQCSFATPKRP